MNQNIDGITVLNSGNYKILFGKIFYTNTRMGNNLVFEYKIPYSYMAQICNNGENQQNPALPPLPQMQHMQMQPMQPIRCYTFKYIYIYLSGIKNNERLQHEESMNPYPDIFNQQAEHAEQMEYQKKQLKMLLYRQWKCVIITDETIINNINTEYQKNKDEFMEKMIKLREMRMRPYNNNYRN
jgi:hypothetical protein